MPGSRGRDAPRRRSRRLSGSATPARAGWAPSSSRQPQGRVQPRAHRSRSMRWYNSPQRFSRIATRSTATSPIPRAIARCGTSCASVRRRAAHGPKRSSPGIRAHTKSALARSPRGTASSTGYSSSTASAATRTASSTTHRAMARSSSRTLTWRALLGSR